MHSGSAPASRQAALENGTRRRSCSPFSKPCDVIWSEDCAGPRQAAFVQHVSVITLDNARVGIMTPTPYLNQSAPRLFEEGIISAIGIHLQVTAIPLQELLRPNPLPRFGVIENHHRMLLNPAVGPDPSCACVWQFVVEHLYTRIVGPDHFGLEQHFLSGS